MGSFSLVHWLIVFGGLLLWGIPSAKILSRTGYSKGWAFLLLIPPIWLVAFWVFAFINWPTDDVE